MKFPLIVTTLIILGFSPALAITADELAKYLNISSWTTTVSLPSESFVVEVYKISDGSLGERIFEGMSAWSKHPEKGLQVMSGPENGKYKIVIAYGSGSTLTINTNVPIFDGTLSSDLPDTIKEGDYVLFGKPKRDGSVPVAESIKSYSEGFVLRVKRKS